MLTRVNNRCLQGRGEQASWSKSIEEEAKFVSEHLWYLFPLYHLLSPDTLILLPSWNLELLQYPSKEYLLP